MSPCLPVFPCPCLCLLFSLSPSVPVVISSLSTSMHLCIHTRAHTFIHAYIHTYTQNDYCGSCESPHAKYPDCAVEESHLSDAEERRALHRLVTPACEAQPLPSTFNGPGYLAHGIPVTMMGMNACSGYLCVCTLSVSISIILSVCLYACMDGEMDAEMHGCLCCMQA